MLLRRLQTIRSAERPRRGPTGRFTFSALFAFTVLARSDHTIDSPALGPARVLIHRPAAQGWVRLEAPAGPDSLVTLQATTDFTSWLPVAVAHDGLAPFADPASAETPHRFYRAAVRRRTASDDFKNQVRLPEDAFLSAPSFGSDEPRWIKFAILTGDPTRVFYQETAKYLFHYDFAVARLEPFRGMTRAQFDAAALHPANQQVVLGAVLFPPLFPDAAPPAEFGVQFVGLDPYPPETVARWFELVKATVAGPPGTKAFYVPTFEQAAAAQQHRAFFESRGIPLATADHWASGDSCYASGWALGRLVFVPAGEIAAAYTRGDLKSADILLTDGVPAEIPVVAGIISLSPATPNSHVAILARSYGVPFVHFVDPAKRQRLEQLVGREVVLRAYSGWEGCEAKVFDVEGQLEPALRGEILGLKTPPPIAITPKQRLGKLSAGAEDLTPADLKFFGGKAANFGFLRRAIPDHSPPAIALSFDLWDDFLEQTLPGGKTLRQHIRERLARHRFPPEVGPLQADLAAIRALIRRDAVFTPDQEEAIRAALAGFDPRRNIRFRSSTNVEDSEHFTGAGLYDSYSGCLADDTDADTAGPSICDPTEADERGVFRAIKRVFASFYNDNAFVERLRHGVNEDHVGMAVLVHHSTPDPEEMANGVATVTPGRFSDEAELVTQLGAVSVANPDRGARPEVVRVTRYDFGTFTEVRARSSLVQLGANVMTWDTDYLDLARLLFSVSEAYQRHFPAKRHLVLDFEYKKVRPGVLQVKQVREIPQPDRTANLAPFLLNEPTEYCVQQGEQGDVLAIHRLKCRLALSTRNLRVSAANLGQSFYAAGALEYHEAGQVRTLEGSLPAWPGAAHSRSDLTVTDRWTLGAGPGLRTYQLRTTLPNLLVSRAESPLLTVQDFDLELAVTYASPVPALNFDGTPAPRREESVRLVRCPAPAEARILQTRVISPKAGVKVETTFYWPMPPRGVVAGYTAPLVRFEETRISGLTTQPLLLRGFYSQTYHPFHHNFVEEFAFEPRLEPGLAPAVLEELRQANIHIILAWSGEEPGRMKILGWEGQFRDVR